MKMAHNRLIINTRPSKRAKQLTNNLMQMGYQVVELPLLTMVKKPLTALDKRWLLQLTQPVSKPAKLTQAKHLAKAKQSLIKRPIVRHPYYDVVVVVSPTAADMAMSAIEQLNDKVDFTQQTMVAVGNATCKTLTEYGISATMPLQASNEGMLQMPVIKNLTEKSRVLIWRGQGGRQLLIDDLQARNIQVDVLELYQRQLPKETELAYQHYINHFEVSNNKKIWVLISSEASFEHWDNMVSKSVNKVLSKTVRDRSDISIDTKKAIMAVSDYYYLTLGSRLTKLLEKKQLKCQQINDLLAKSIIKVIDKYDS